MAAASNDIVRSLQERVRTAIAARTPLVIRAGGTKDFYGRAAPTTYEVLDPRAYCGIIQHEPTELVVTACSGTPLAEVEAALGQHNQMLAFEPPHFGPTATLGGAIASGFAGPRRIAAGAARDFVLGATLLDGHANVLSFGGNVMKNVAGYDVSRALAGSLGTLGIILDVSLKVMPRPPAEQTLRFELPEADAVRRTNEWARHPWPISATAWIDGVLTVRLSGAAAGVRAALAKLGGGVVPDGAAFWTTLREHTHTFFERPDSSTLWRLSVPPATVPLNLGATLIEWRGAQRWIRSNRPAAEIRARVQTAGGHATAFRDHDRNDVFHPLAPALAQIHQRLKREFDPMGIFNPGRMYSNF
ncbi:MAG TPA: glycolate oxidase subunit GlcE [Burkholderiaceae bacterium]|nr:glycolate oxidase subunit GlcE [Burkholderiaceae bacterium]